MVNLPKKLTSLLLVICVCSCNKTPETAQTIAAQGPVVTSDAEMPIEPGFYQNGEQYEFVSGILAKANASIRLDYHAGIQWYEPTKKTWSTLETIQEVKPLLASIETKRLVTVATGKALWDKHDLYIDRINDFAEELGFEMTIVTDDSAEGLTVSKVVQHQL